MTALDKIILGILALVEEKVLLEAADSSASDACVSAMASGELSRRGDEFSRMLDIHFGARRDVKPGTTLYESADGVELYFVRNNDGTCKIELYPARGVITWVSADGADQLRNMLNHYCRVKKG